MHDKIRNLFELTKQGDLRGLARFLSALEESGAEALRVLPDFLRPNRQAFRVGITGPPGAGKSTLLSEMVSKLRAQNKKIAVLAVDPSSPFSRGAILGDRLRYSEHFLDPSVFIRSLGSRGSFGGLSAATYLQARAFDWAGYDYLLIETVGVGQTELEVMHVADWVAVVLVPESGDSVQGMKAGLMEIADLFLVNKADRPGAAAFQHELESALSLDSWSSEPGAKVMLVSALQKTGVDTVLQEIETTKHLRLWQRERFNPRRLQAEARALLRAEFARAMDARVESIANERDLLSVLNLEPPEAV